MKEFGGKSAISALKPHLSIRAFNLKKIIDVILHVSTMQMIGSPVYLVKNYVEVLPFNTKFFEHVHHEKLLNFVKLFLHLLK